MSLTSFIFYFFLFGAGLSALGILLIRNIFRAALLLLVCLLSVAALFVLSFAEFVAVSQILIYAGGILVIILFAIMLTAKVSGKPMQVTNANTLGGLFLSVSMFVMLTYYMRTDIPAGTPPIRNSADNIENIGMNLVTRYALPFEIAGVVLLIALVGAAVVASFTKTNK